MNERDSNIGQEGVESIRIKGKRIEDLPLGQGNEAKEQLPDAIETQRINKIEGVIAKFPKQRIDYLDSRIVECKGNIDRMMKTITEQNQMISDYKGHIAMCKHRDTLIERQECKLINKKITQEEFDEDKKLLNKQFLPYDVAAMEQQIVQCEEGIERCNEVIKRENLSVTEFSEVRALCVHRDLELAKYGAVAEG